MQARERAHVLEQRAFDAHEFDRHLRVVLLVLAEAGQRRERGTRRGRCKERQAEGGNEEARHEKSDRAPATAFQRPRDQHDDRNQREHGQEERERGEQQGTAEFRGRINGIAEAA